MQLFQHRDSLQDLNQSFSFQQKLDFLRNTICQRFHDLDRIAIALYSVSDDMLSTFAFSSREPNPLANYQAKLADCPSLLETYKTRQPRLLKDLNSFKNSHKTHTKWVLKAGYASSYTFPLFAEGCFMGFLFFNSKQKNAFHRAILNELDMTGHLIAFMLYSERSKIKTLVATIRSAKDMSHKRDPETGQHLERMAYYSQLIARELVPSFNLNDTFVDHIFLFAPLHDIGKLTIPDNILLKPGPLTILERSVMQTHTQNGREIIDQLLENYGLDGVEHVDMLRNIVLYHHESMDGSGYPEQLQDRSIPIEARIISVADVFDALTSERPYKPAWDNNRAFKELRELAGKKLDTECVEALLKNAEAIESIQRRFCANRFG